MDCSLTTVYSFGDPHYKLCWINCKSHALLYLFFSYDSARSLDAFVSYIEKKLKEDKGLAQLEILEPIAKAFIDAEDKEALIKDAEKKLESASDSEKANGEIYLKVMRKALEKGADYFEKEEARISRILASGNVNQDKADDMNSKLSVLSAFLSSEES